MAPNGRIGHTNFHEKSIKRWNGHVDGRIYTNNTVTSSVNVSTFKDGKQAKQNTGFYHVQTYVP